MKKWAYLILAGVLLVNVPIAIIILIFNLLNLDALGDRGLGMVIMRFVLQLAIGIGGWTLLRYTLRLFQKARSKVVSA